MDSYERLQPVRVPDFVPLLAHRFARERLLAAARAQGLSSGGAPSVLFVCTHNAGRSQLAAALLTALVGERVQVTSAGSWPATEVATEIVTALHEVGLEAAALYPKPITDEVVRGADVVVTMGCGDSCPVVPGRRYLDWDVLDLEGADEDTVRRIRDDLAGRVHRLASDLGVLDQPDSAEDGVPQTTGR
jgi:arsenate reductase